MHDPRFILPPGHRPWQRLFLLFLTVFLIAALGAALLPGWIARAQDDGPVQFEQGIDPEQWYQDHQIEQSWKPDYIPLATGDPHVFGRHGVYAWPFALDSIGWNMQSYQGYGGTPYFHHGMDMMKTYGTMVYNRSGGQVINIENYQPGMELYWEVAILDPDGYIWQYHHIDSNTIPEYIWDKYAQYQANPATGGFVPPDTYIGNIIEWPVWSFGKQFNHIHLNILAAGGVYVNGFAFHLPLPDTAGPQIQSVGLLQNGQPYTGNTIEGNYSLYVQANDLILDDVFYLPPWKIAFSVDGGPLHTTWQFDTLPGGPDDTAYLDDFYVVPPTCGNYECRDFYIDLGFIPDSQFVFPDTGGQHTIAVTVSDYAGSSATQAYTYTVIAPPPGILVWQDDFETSLGWTPNPAGTDTATSGQWERGNPEDTSSGGPKQLGTTPSGSNDLVTGRLAGSGPRSNDLDGGVTSIRSPNISLPDVDTLTLSFRYYLAHASDASNADYLRVTVVGPISTTVLEEVGAVENDNATWGISNVDISAFAGQTVYLLVTAADGGSESLVEAGIDNVMILNTTNHPPTAGAQSLPTPEDTPLAILLAGSDPDNDPLTFAVASGPTYGVLGGIAPNLVYTPTANYHGPDSFTFVANDGHTSSDPAAVTITVSPVNDFPTLSDIPAQTTNEDTPLPAIAFTIGDVETPAISLTLTATSSNTTLFTPGHINLEGTGAQHTLAISPTTNLSASAIITVTVSDGERAASDSFLVTVTPVNDAPILDPVGNQAVYTGETLTFTVSASDVDASSLTFSLDPAAPPGATLDAQTGVFTWTPAASGVYTLTIRVTDDGLPSLEDSETLTITVTTRRDFIAYLPVVRGP